MQFDDEPSGNENHDPAMRPRSLDEFVGQPRIVDNLRVYIRAARKRGESLDHVLLSGPPGLGKTSLAYILAEEMGAECRTASGPTIERGGDLAAILTSLQQGDVLFIDEIHRMNRAVEEVLYPAMEDYEIDIILGSGPGAQSVKLPVPPFTLVGATTRSGMLSSPLRARFGIQATFDYYAPDELARILTRSAALMRVSITEQGCLVLAQRSRGTPRVANRLLRRVRDFADIEGDGTVDARIVDLALDRLQVDHAGLAKLDRRLLHTIAVKFSGGPVGIETLAAAIGESRDTLEEANEPFLIQQGFLQRTPRGRVITPRGLRHLGLPDPGQSELF